MAEEAPTSCANCGREEEAELKSDSCKLEKCGKDCRVAISQHENACKKRAAELHDEALFKQPPKGNDCPICILPLPALGSGRHFRACCGKTICSGCFHEHYLQSSGSPTCPFCRAKLPSTALEFIKMLEKRVDANDSDAILQLGMLYLLGDEDLSITKEIDKAIKLLHRAAELGSAEAYNSLGVLYGRGDDVSTDEAKANQYSEKAAMAGCVNSRIVLGNIDAKAGSFDRAVKHWLIGASCGDIRAVNRLKEAMIDGGATRDDYAQALREYKQYLDQVTSYQRDRAAAYSDQFKYLIEEHKCCCNEGCPNSYVLIR
jgi:TPR repeat protein